MTPPPKGKTPLVPPSSDGGRDDGVAASTRRARVLRRSLQGTAIVGLIFLVGMGGLYLNRRAVARAVLEGWLDRRNVPTELTIERADLDGFVARVRLGDPAHPDLSIQRVEVDYVLGMPWSQGGLGLQPGRIRLVQPQVRVRWQDGRWSLGSLDTLIETLMSRPPGPDQAGPLILVEGARIAVITPGGEATVVGDARIDKGRLQRLTARVPQSSLGSDAVRWRDLVAAVDVTTRDNEILIGLVGRAEALTHSGDQAPQQQARDVALRLAARVPYPEQNRIAQPQRLWSDVRLQMQRGELPAAEGRRIDGHVTFEGLVQGSLDAFTLTGQMQGDLAAEGLAGRQGRVSDLRLQLPDSTLALSRTVGAETRWTLQGPMRLLAGTLETQAVSGDTLVLSTGHIRLAGHGAGFDARGPLTLTASRMQTGDLALRQTHVVGTVQADLAEAPRVRFDGQADVRSVAWRGLGPPQSTDIEEVARLKRALGDFALAVPAIALIVNPDGYALDLGRDAIVRPRTGGQVVVSPGAGPFLASRGGAAAVGSLRVRADLPGGLPSGRLDIQQWGPVPGGFDVSLSADVGLDFGLARGLTVAGQGRLASRRGRLTFRPTECADVTVQTLDLGESDVLDMTGMLCPGRDPLFAMENGHWQVQGEVQGGSASVPFLVLAGRQVGGHLQAGGGSGGVGLSLGGANGQVVDQTDPQRFNPLSLSGDVGLADDVWQGAFDVATTGGQALGQMQLTHDGRRGAGGLTIEVPDLVFVEGGLQPSTLSPLAASLAASPVRGHASFGGGIDWQDGAEGRSAGSVTLTDLDFTSPAGPVHGLNGTVRFTSLAPLTTAPGQQLVARDLETVVTLRNPVITFGLDQAAVTLDGGEVQLGGGRLRIEPLTIPLGPDPLIEGVVVLESIQLGDLVTEAGFGDSVDMDAVVSGRLPFIRNSDGTLRFTGGQLYAVQPGRLSIHREALSGVNASGGAEGAAPGMVEDLAYQAMEHLSFQTLSADVDSQQDGRLAVRFHIDGAFDPPEHQELRLTYAELLSRQFLNRTLPLPSGTQVKLTLDTTLNLDQLLQDLAEVSRARRGQ